MDELFARMLLLEEIEIMLIALALIVVGGILGSVIAKPERRYTRIQYLWVWAGLNLALSASQFGWLLVPSAAGAGFMSALVLFLGACFLLFGMVAYYASAARSNDIVGDTRKAWMGFVPIVNLWLIFTAGRARPEEDGTSSPVRRLLVNPVLVIAALFVFGVGQLFEKALDEVPAESIATSPEFATLIASVQTLEESLASEAKATSEELPMRVDEVTVFRAAEAKGDTLVFTMEVERDFTGFKDEFKRGLAETVCAPDMFAYDINRGGKIVYVYNGPRNNIIDEIEVTKADC